MGNSQKIFRALGSSSHAQGDRADEDFYATDPKAIDCLLSVSSDLLDKKTTIWGCACGQGHLSKRLIDNGFSVYSSDKVDRGYGVKADFFTAPIPQTPCNIITNPPYKLAERFVRRALDVVENGAIVAMFLRLLFLEGEKRSVLFEQFPPKRIGIFSFRLPCAKNGDFATYNGSAVAYAWFVWQKGFKGEPQIRWIRKPQNQDNQMSILSLRAKYIGNQSQTFNTDK